MLVVDVGSGLELLAALFILRNTKFFEAKLLLTIKACHQVLDSRFNAGLSLPRRNMRRKTKR